MNVKRLIVIPVILALAACGPIDKSETARKFEDMCDPAETVDVTWHSKTGHFSITCTVEREQIDVFNKKAMEDGK